MAFPSTTTPTTTSFASSVTSMAVNLPTSISPGDLLIAAGGFRNPGTWTPPRKKTSYYLDGHINFSYETTTNPNNLIDGNIATVGTLGTADNVYIAGSNAPSSGATILSVRARVHNGTAWQAWGNLTAPGGGFTWSYVRDKLAYYVYDNSGIIGGGEVFDWDDYDPVNSIPKPASGLTISKIEIEVTTDESGWILLNEQAGGGGVGETGVWYRIANGTEESTATWGTSVATTGAWHVYKVTDWHGTTPPEYTSTNGDSVAVNPPSLTPSWGAVDTLWIALAGSSANAMTFSVAPTNYTGLTSTTASSGGGASNMGSAYRQLNASSEDPGTFTTSQNRWWAAFTIAIRPASGGGSYAMTLNDSAATTSSLARSLNRSLSNSVGKTDTISKVSTLIRAYSETVTATSTLAKLISRLLNDSSTSADTISKAQTHVRSLSDSVAAASAIIRSITKTKGDSVAPADSILKSLQRSILDTQSAIDSITISLVIARSYSDFVAASDNLASALTHRRTLSETVAAADSILRYLAVNKIDQVDDEDSLVTSLTGLLQFLETLIIADTIAKQTYKVHLDTVGNNETLLKQLNKIFADQVRADDSISTSIYKVLDFVETVVTVDNIARFTMKALSDIVLNVEQISFVSIIGRTFNDTVGNSEVITKLRTAIKSFDDSTGVSDFISKFISKSYNETIVVVDKGLKKFLNGIELVWTKVTKILGDWTKREKTTPEDWDKAAKISGSWDKNERPSAGTWNKNERPEDDDWTKQSRP